MYSTHKASFFAPSALVMVRGNSTTISLSLDICSEDLYEPSSLSLSHGNTWSPDGVSLRRIKKCDVWGSLSLKAGVVISEDSRRVECTLSDSCVA